MISDYLGLDSETVSKLGDLKPIPLFLCKRPDMPQLRDTIPMSSSPSTKLVGFSWRRQVLLCVTTHGRWAGLNVV